jgi:uncharacterized metal-binding protein
MASGKTHDASILFTTPIVMIALFQPEVGIMFSLALSSLYIFSGLYLSPDMDMSHSRPSQRWGLLKWYWIPYQAIFKHQGCFFNRNPFTHFPILGTVIRVAYLLIIPALFLVSSEFNDWDVALYWLIVLLISCELASLVHLFLDIIYTKSRKH